MGVVRDRVQGVVRRGGERGGDHAGGVRAVEGEGHVSVGDVLVRGEVREGVGGVGGCRRGWGGEFCGVGGRGG